MSSQKGNVSRTRSQKHKNRTVFKNNLHDTSNQTKLINSIQVSDVCVRCKEIIEWKIKYKKYKPLKQPRTCVNCSQKTVKQAYHIMCKSCAASLGVCTKCCQKKDILEAAPSQKEQITLDNELKQLVKSLPERKRRSFLRYLNDKSKNINKENPSENKQTDTQNDINDDLMKKLAVSSKSDDEDGAFSDEFGFSDDEDDGSTN